MKVLVVYSSKTGNTRRVAEEIAGALGVPAIPVEEKPNAADYDLVIAGYWVDRGAVDAKMKAYLGELAGGRVAVFATLGARADSEHAAKSLEAGKALAGAGGAQVIGGFICQGKVDPALVEMMKGMFPAGHPHAMTPERLAGIAEAAEHPNAEDLRAARDYFTALVEAERDRVAKES